MGRPAWGLGLAIEGAGPGETSGVLAAFSGISCSRRKLIFSPWTMRASAAMSMTIWCLLSWSRPSKRSVLRFSMTEKEHMMNDDPNFTFAE
jgi:hypothetical protein